MGGVPLCAGSGGVGGEPLSVQGCHGRGSSEWHRHQGAKAGRRCRVPEKEVARGSRGGERRPWPAARILGKTVRGRSANAPKTCCSQSLLET